jgi:hypothetical protein
MIRLSSPYKSDTKQTPIEMLLARMKQSQQDEARADVKEKVDKQYEMLRAGNREVMLRRLHNDKTTSQLSNISSKTQSTGDLDNQGLMKIKTKKDFQEEAKKKYNKDLAQRTIDCNRGAMTACAYVSKKKITIDSIANDLSIEYNKKATDFNTKLKSQVKKNPLTTSSDLIIDPETGRIVNNPVVINLQNQEKLKELMNQRTSSDAYKIGQQMKEREQNIINIGNPNVASDKPTNTGLIKYGQFLLPQSKINELEKTKKTNPTLYYQELRDLANIKPEEKTTLQQRSYQDVKRAFETIPESNIDKIFTS